MSSTAARRATAGAKKRGLPKRVRMRHDQHFVDELVQRNEVSIGRLVSLSSIEPDPNQPRTFVGDLSDLVSSIRDKGVLEPILVRRMPPPAEAENPAAGEPKSEGAVAIWRATESSNARSMCSMRTSVTGFCCTTSTSRPGESP